MSEPEPAFAGDGIQFNHPYFDLFFEEKRLPLVGWSIEKGDTVNIIDNQVVLEHVAIAPREEQDSIADVIRRIDFANGDVNHFLRHLAGALAQEL